MKLAEAYQETQKILKNLNTVIKGKEPQLRQAVICLIADGNLLIEDVPGVGKTVLAKALARSIHGSFSRIQFTPDLLPSDITGSAIYNQRTQEFEFRQGPIFSNIVLADEINRTTPRTQASLLEAMEEKHVSADGMTYPLPKPFFVMATQNPLEFHGTYPLPEGQLDRFFISINMGYPGRETELDILKSQKLAHPLDTVEAVTTAERVCELQAATREVKIVDPLLKYMIEIANRCREHPEVLVGLSPRGTLGLMRNSQALALISNRDYVIPDDIKEVAEATIAHRLILRTPTRTGNQKAREIVRNILLEIPVPTIKLNFSRS